MDMLTGPAFVGLAIAAIFLLLLGIAGLLALIAYLGRGLRGRKDDSSGHRSLAP